MHFRSIIHVVGLLLVVTGSSMFLPAIWSIYYHEADLLPIFYSALIAIFLGLSLWPRYRKHIELNIKDSIFIAVFGWLLVSAVSALPFMIHGSIPSFTDAFFEMMSGYTTTGATILTDIESLPHGLLFWRSETHLLGGMGFLTLTIMFLPKGMGGLRIFRADSSPGQVITKEKFKARNKDTVIMLWAIYLSLNLLEILLLSLGGMPLFDSMCHAFGTISTSGYSTKNAGIGYYDNAYFDWVLTLFMFLGGVNFILFYQVLSRDWKAVKMNTELRWYGAITLFFCVVVSLILWRENVYGSLIESLRYGFFQVVSLLTTTGFGTADYEQWPQAAQMFLYTVCFVGPSAGSTGSGIKIVYFVIIIKFIHAFIRKSFSQPLAVTSIRINQKSVDTTIINFAVCYFIINIFMVLLGGCFMVLVDDMDYVTGMSSVIASLMNIGPGFGAVGPSENYALVSDAGKWFLSWNMMVGRLEMFSALVVFYPSFWKK
ncbi:MAG: TrkH family potassium uptake protein [Desulfobulbaceae bacterium]|nr:TrkH family potassium uptake protein [Desulfobulbaceae bacterium]